MKTASYVSRSFFAEIVVGPSCSPTSIPVRISTPSC
jgi:hypothetical protein